MATSEPPLIDFFLVVGISEGRLAQACHTRGEDVVFSERLSGGGEVLCRCQADDTDGFQLNVATLPLFCFPQELLLVRDPLPPTSHSFVLTKGDGGSVFGFVHTFYERFVQLLDPATPTDELFHGYVPKCLVVLSRWPLFTSLPRYLEQLLSYSRTTDALNRVPVECFISQLCYEIPVPQPGGPIVVFGLPQPSEEARGHLGQPQGQQQAGEGADGLLVKVASEEESRARAESVRAASQAEKALFEPIVLRRPPSADFPWLELNLGMLFRRLSPKNVIAVFRFLLFERRVILVSSSLSLLTPLAEIFTRLLFPLDWQHVFIPLLAQRLSHFLEAPMPYLVGLERTLLDTVVLPGDSVVVDLDNDEILVLEDSLPPIPEQEGRILTEALCQLAADYQEVLSCQNGQGGLVFALADSTEKELTKGVRMAFLDFFAALLLEYESYLLVHEQARTSARSSPDLDPSANTNATLPSVVQQDDSIEFVSPILFSLKNKTNNYQQNNIFRYCC